MNETLSRPRGLLVALILTLLPAVTACGGDDASDPIVEPEPDAGGETPSGLEAIIRRTSYGVPHITAGDWESLGYGVGYAQAEDHICVLADQYVKVRSQRARYFGPGANDANVNSDFGFLNLGFYEQVAASLQEQPEVAAMAEGFAAGYNRFLEEAGVDGLPAECAGAEWVTPVTAVDVAAGVFQLTMLTSSLQLVDLIGSAQPPTSDAKRAAELTIDGLPDFGRPVIGSNGIGLGLELTEGGGGMLLANPHFPWEGELRFWEVHATIPGTLDVYGATVIGAPLPIIGFNEQLAWTHTVSLSQQFTGYVLELVPGDPTSYRYDDETRQMTSQEHIIEVLGDDGQLETLTRTMYRSHYGPILNIQPLGWSNALAFSYRDANADNVSLGEQYIAFAQAQNLGDFEAALRDLHAVPLMHTVYADAAGNALYADASQVPNLSDEAVDEWLERRESDVLTRTAWEDFGFVLLDGSDSRFEWVADAGARSPGLVPFDRSPLLVREDFVINGNNSHWAVNPAELLEGYSPLFGPEQTPLSPRARLGLTLLSETEGGAAGEDGRFSPAELEALFFNDRALASELWLDDVVTRCGALDAVDLGDGPIDLNEACSLLADWDGTLDPSAPGVVLWRELVGAFDLDDYSDDSLFAVPFEAADPIGTPRGAAVAAEAGDDRFISALATAVDRLTTADIPLDATLEALQFTLKGEQTIAVPGGLEIEGAFNITSHEQLNSTLLPRIGRGDVVNPQTRLTTEGYVINYGASFVLLVSFGDEGPEARALMAYSQSMDARSPHFDDQTRLFSTETLRPVRFVEADVEADPALTSRILRP